MDILAELEKLETSIKENQQNKVYTAPAAAGMQRQPQQLQPNQQQQLQPQQRQLQPLQQQLKQQQSARPIAKPPVAGGQKVNASQQMQQSQANKKNQQVVNPYEQPPKPPEITTPKEIPSDLNVWKTPPEAEEYKQPSHPDSISVKKKRTFKELFTQKLGSDDFQRGLIMSEILGKPKALKK